MKLDSSWVLSIVEETYPSYSCTLSTDNKKIIVDGIEYPCMCVNKSGLNILLRTILFDKIKPMVSYTCFLKIKETAVDLKLI